MTYKYLTVGNEWTKHRFSRKRLSGKLSINLDFKTTVL